MTEVQHHATLLESRAVQNAILASSRFSVMVANKEGMIQLFNVGAERMLGYSSAEVVDKIPLVDLYDPQEVMARTRELSLEFSTDIASGFETLIYKASRGIEDGYELTYRCKDGSRRPTAVSISALRDDDGSNLGYLLVGADDSARQQLEMRLHEALSDAKTADVARANRLSNVCHELRTPLNAILGFAQLMASGVPSPTSSQQRNIDLILEAGWQQQNLISEVLDLASVESGKLSLSLEPVSLAEIMLDCQRLTEPQAHTRGVKLVFPPVKTSYYVKADRIRVRQVLTSLVSHAIHSSQDGGAVVVDCDTRNPQSIRFCIQDSSGLCADPLTQVLQAPKLDGDDRTTEPGAGVGMVLTERLVGSMGGCIGVSSNVGADRVVWFELQRVDPPAAATSCTDSSLEQAAAPRYYRTISRKK